MATATTMMRRSRVTERLVAGYDPRDVFEVYDSHLEMTDGRNLGCPAGQPVRSSSMTGALMAVADIQHVSAKSRAA